MKSKLSLFILVAVQIFILVNFPISNNYFLGVEEADIVSATTFNCCTETTNGAVCQDLASTNSAGCENGLLSTTCANSADCSIGCCIDNTEGLCAPQSTKFSCESGGGIWANDQGCLNAVCQKGCCVLGNNAQFVTEQRCERLSLLQGFTKDFRNINTEIACLAITATQDEGACISNNNCTLETQQVCLTMEGVFHKDYLCSNSNLNSNCTKQASVNCVANKDEIYWFDSCGNRENIYEGGSNAAKDRSWNNGMLMNKSSSCNPGSSNINSETCGNCEYTLGSKCASVSLGKKVKDGNFICENMNCEDSKGNTKINGESWCEYDGSIGETKGPWDIKKKRTYRFPVCTDYLGESCDLYANDELICLGDEAYSCKEDFDMGSGSWARQIFKDVNCSMYNESCGCSTTPVQAQSPICATYLDSSCSGSSLICNGKQAYSCEDVQQGDWKWVRKVSKDGDCSKYNANCKDSSDPVQPPACTTYLNTDCSLYSEGKKICWGNDAYKCQEDFQLQSKDWVRDKEGDKDCLQYNGNCENSSAGVCQDDSLLFSNDFASDTVGSRHWLRGCVDGDVIGTGCSDYRGQICIQQTVNNNQTDQNFSMAGCIINDVRKCLDYNKDSNMTSKCQEDKLCMIKNVDVDEGFKFNVCVGRYSPGFDLTDPVSGGGSLCALASQKCIVSYQKGITGNWKCRGNCECETDSFTKQMNDFCVSLGDCGSYVNYIGKGTDNIQVTGAPGISWAKYSHYANVVEGQYAEPPNMSDYMSSITGNAESPGAASASQIELLGQIIGGAGALVHVASSLGFVSLTQVAPGVSLDFIMGGAAKAGAPMTATPLAAFAGAAAGAAMGAMAGSYLAAELGISGSAANVMTISGGVAGGVIGYSMVVKGALTTGQIWAIGAAVVVMVYISAIGWGKTESRTVEFTCMPWQAPVGGSDCDKCDDDPTRPCTEYRCSSLGQACKILNVHEQNPVCQSIAYELNPPVISAGDNITNGYKFTEIDSQTIKIGKTNGGCVQEFTPIVFSLETDEFSQCKYSFNRTNSYADMTLYGLSQNSFTKNHKFGFSMPSLTSLEIHGITGDLKERFGNMNMYIRCQDYHGNSNPIEYTVKFCVNSQPDGTAVNHGLTVMNPADNSYVKYGTTQQNLSMWVNEPAECKYDSASGKAYDNMTGTMSCMTRLADSQMYGWPCSTVLNVVNGTNSFYFKCKDKPWVQTAADLAKYKERNVNAQDLDYTVNVVETPLTISSITPQGTIQSGSSPVSVDLNVQTSGGVSNGDATCYYQWAGNWVQFVNTFSNTHSQIGLNLMGGNFSIPIKCEDTAGDLATGNSVFNIHVDSVPPIAVRVFKDGSNLKLITDENAKCYYDLNSCGFNLLNGTAMTSTFSTGHTTSWVAGQTYYIKCKDLWDNENPSCIINVEPSAL